MASNWAEFSAALSQWSWPTQNVVYSDDQGHIAYQAVGRIPLRPAGLQGKPIEEARTSGRATFHSVRCPMQSIRLRAFWPLPTPA